MNQEDTAFLHKLELSLPEIHDYIDGVNTQNKSKSHKECAPAFVTQFKSDCQKLYSKITRNPFNDSIFRKVNSDFIFPSVISEDSRKVFKAGLTQYQDFMKNRFVIGCEDVLKTPIKHNGLKLPKDVSAVVAENPRIKISSASLTKLRDACSFRRSEVKESFKSELTNVPECMTKDGKPYHSSKSKILDIVSNIAFPKREILNGAGLVVDLSVVIRTRMYTMKPGSTYFDLASAVLTDIEGNANSISAPRMI